jgi:hypothetical protein
MCSIGCNTGRSKWPPLWKVLVVVLVVVDVEMDEALLEYHATVMDNATRSKLLRARTTTTMMMLSRILEEKCGR